MKTIEYTGVQSPWYDTLGGSGLTWTTGMQAELKNDVADELLGYVTIFKFIRESGSAVTLPNMQAAYDAGSAEEKAAFQASVSGDVVSVASSRSLVAADDGDRLHCTGTVTLTVPAGLGSKFGCAVYGSVTIAAGAGVTLTDWRVSGAANPVCAIEPTSTADTYLLVGSKA